MKTRLSFFLCTIGCFLLVTGVGSSRPAGKSTSGTRSNPELRLLQPASKQIGPAKSRRPEVGGISVIGQSAGPTPFIANVQLHASNPSSVKSITFTVSPKPGSVTRPISALCTAEYLQSRGYFNLQTGEITLPVFGLYADYNNQVTLDCSFDRPPRQQLMVSIQTAAFNDPCGYANPTIVQPRTNDTSLSYDYMLLKGKCGTQSPVIIDTDAAVRWVGTAGVTAFASIFHDNGIYIATPPPSSLSVTGITRMELDGSYAFLKDYADIGVVLSGHHNYDPGKRGILVQVDTADWIESEILEVNPTTGNVLKSWNFADIISAAMIAGGDDPDQFVESGIDWFHNNAATYRASDDSLVVSSRENFVISVDYESGAIKWILGDPAKQWYQFQSLRSYALSLGQNSLPPIGQHAISFTYDDHLLLFDNGLSSSHHTPPGDNRSYSAPRKYKIDQVNRIATEVWSYPNGESINSRVCSSVYEDKPLNYLIDYAAVTASAPILIGLNSAGDTVFDYIYRNGCSRGWNTIPVHLEQLAFTNPPLATVVSRMTHGSAGTFDVTLPLNGPAGIECRRSNSLGEGNYALVFRFVNDLVTVGSATVTSGNASIASSNIGGDARDYIVNLTRVANAQQIAVKLNGLTDSAGNFGSSLSVSMRVLIGDIIDNGAVSSSDIAEIKSQSGWPVTAANFRADIDANGSPNNTDVSLVKHFLGSALP